jgi:hypothetical protein
MKMVEYECQKCKKLFTRKADYDRHTGTVKCEYSGSKTKKKLPIHKCIHCKFSCNRKDVLTRHLKTCKEKPEKTVKTTKIISAKGSNNKVGETVIDNSTIDNSTNIINHNYFILSGFGKDGISSLTHEEAADIFNSNKNVFENIITKVNFNSNKPEYHNVYWADMKSAYGKVYENNKWTTKKINEIIDTLIDAKKDDLNKLLNVFKPSLNGECIDKIKESLGRVSYSKDDQRKQLIKYLKPIFYDNKDMVLKTMKRLGIEIDDDDDDD